MKRPQQRSRSYRPGTGPDYVHVVNVGTGESYAPSATWWSEMDRGRGIAYPNARGEFTPLIDGKTGDIVLFSKAEQHAAGYGHNNDAFRVMKAMERFDELKVIR